MKIINLSEAKAAGLTKYFTGKPCKHGHVAERYVGGGACTDCLSVNNGRDPEAVERRPAAESRAALAHKLEAIPEQRIRAHLVDVPALQTMATMLCLARDPTLTPDEVRSRSPVKKLEGTVGMYAFRFPAEDIDVMRGYGNKLLGAHVDPAMLARTRSGIVRQATDLALEERAAGIPGEWTFT